MKFNILLLILVTTMVVFACNKKASQKTMNSEEVTQQQDPAEPAPEPTPRRKRGTHQGRFRTLRDAEV